MTTEVTTPNTPEGAEPARNSVCRHCGAEGLTMVELAAHGRQRKRTGQCLPDATTEQPIAADMQPDDGAALDEQISNYVCELAGRRFICQSTNWISDHGAQQIARLVLEDEMDLDAAARQVLSGFAGWAEEAA